MSTEVASQLATAERATLIAPAGHGKTWTLARTAALAPAPQLILTHTHAGIHALRRQLRDAGASPDSYRLDTIAGFAARWATAYPEVAEWEPGDQPADWRGLYSAACRVLARPQLLSSVAHSFAGVLVDEYQDCTLEQHQLVLGLATVLPTRVVGDPLQGIYDFPDSPSVDFEQHVLPHFPSTGSLPTAWRWKENPALASDLAHLRQELWAGEQPDLAGYAAFSVERPDRGASVRACNRATQLPGTTVAIRAHAQQAHALAKKLRGQFQSIEDLEGKNILSAAAKIEDTCGPARAAALLDVIENCTNGVVPALRQTRRSYEEDQLPRVPRGKSQRAVTALNALASESSFEGLPEAIDALCSHPDAVVYRSEVLMTLANGVELLAAQDVAVTDSLVSGVREVRDRQRRTGRRLPKHIVARTRLVKGLQFDNVVVCDVSQLDTHNLYVALTRGASTVTICPDE